MVFGGASDHRIVAAAAVSSDALFSRDYERRYTRTDACFLPTSNYAPTKTS